MCQDCFLRLDNADNIYFQLKVVLLRTCFWWSKPVVNTLSFMGQELEKNYTALNLWKEYMLWNQSGF